MPAPTISASAFTEPIAEGSIMLNILITGASSGIGLATAVTLARAGHTVIATMRNLDAAGELSKLVAAEQLPVTMLALDVDDDASVFGAFERVLVGYGHVDVLVNNAGIGGPGAVEETTLDSFSADHGNQLLRFATLHQSGAARHALTARWLHHQSQFGSRPYRPCPAGGIRGLKTRARSPERMPCPGGPGLDVAL
jgi:NAD(P)-dependent dehydrogenase (short-subunit alcohol dehydrogenase family)